MKELCGCDDKRTLAGFANLDISHQSLDDSHQRPIEQGALEIGHAVIQGLLVQFLVRASVDRRDEQSRRDAQQAVRPRISQDGVVDALAPCVEKGLIPAFQRLLVLALELVWSVSVSADTACWNAPPR